MRIRVLAFAHLRELLGVSETVLQLPESARVNDAWEALAERCPGLRAEHGCTRIARNGSLAQSGDALADGDELAILPPVGGG